MYKVSVICPIYGVQEFIGRCASSLLNQTLNEIEFIFINDATNDNSISILNDIVNQHPERKEHIFIIGHPFNKGLPSARNTGLSVATGEYIFHCDGDDFVEPEMLEELYNDATMHNADLVWCDYYESYPEKEVYKKEPYYSASPEALTGVLSRHMQYNVWNKLVKKELYDKFKIAFPDGRPMGEDLTMIKLISVSQTVHYVPKAYYHYVRWNTLAMTQSTSEEKLLNLKQNIHDVDTFLEIRYKSKLTKEISYLKLWSKYRFLLTDGKNGEYTLFKNWFPESNVYIWSLPNANLRIKLLFWFASINHFWFVKMHYHLIIRWFYSLRRS